MRKHYLDSALVCALSAISFCFNIDQAIGKKPAAEKKRPVFAAATKIRKGEKIQKRMLVEVLLPESEIPTDAVEYRRLIVGQRPDHEIPRKKIIQIGDFPDLGGISAPFVYTTREITAGSCIKKSDLKLSPNLINSPVQLIPPRPTSITTVVGKKARTTLAKDHKVVNSDIIP
jgi:flagella basal body P-ring formation protein FlgA